MERNYHCIGEEQKDVKTMRKHSKSLRDIADLRKVSILCAKCFNQKRSESILWQTKEKQFGNRQTDNHIGKRRAFQIIDNKISPATVRRCLVQANLPGRIARKILLIRKQNLKIRLQFAEKHLLWPGKDGNKKLAKYGILLTWVDGHFLTYKSISQVYLLL